MGGAPLIEYLTDKLESEALSIIETIEDMGGMMAAIERDWPQAQIRAYEETYREKVQSDPPEIVIVGQNKFNDQKNLVLGFSVSKKDQERQIKTLKNIRKKRSKYEVEKSLDNLKKVLESDKNCMEAVCQAVETLATEGEICNVFRQIYGTYSETMELP